LGKGGGIMSNMIMDGLRYILRIEKAKKSSKLVPKKVQVMRNGKQFTMTVYVDPTGEDKGPAQGGLFDVDSPETFKKEEKKKEHNKTWKELITEHMVPEDEFMPAAMRSGTDEYKKQLSTRERAYEKASKSGITFREKNIAMDFIGLDIEKIMSSIDRADDPESMARFALDYAEKLGGAVPPGTMKQLREKLNAMEKTKDVAKKMPKRPGVPKKKELTYKDLENTANFMQANGIISTNKRSVDYKKAKELMEEFESLGVFTGEIKSEMAIDYLKNRIRSIDSFAKNKGSMPRVDRAARQDYTKQIKAIEQGGNPGKEVLSPAFMDGAAYLALHRDHRDGYEFDNDHGLRQADRIKRMLFQYDVPNTPQKKQKGSEPKNEISVGDTVYMEDAYDPKKRIPVQFRGFHGDKAIVIMNGYQMPVEKDRIFKENNAGKKSPAKSWDAMPFSEKKEKMIEFYKDRIKVEENKSERYRLEETLDKLKRINHEVYLKNFVDKPIDARIKELG
jgi:hypothetical protein